MVQFAELVLTSKTEGLKSGKAALVELRNEGERTEKAVTGSTGKVSKGFDGIGVSANKMAVAAASALAAVASIGSIVRGAESYNTIINGFRGMGQSAEQAAMSLNSVAEIAANTRAPLEATANLYRRVSVAAGELGASQQEVRRFTENVGLALAASGTSADQASGALLQLSQAMAGGTVRAEEFNSILEGAFPIAQAAAAGIDEAGGSVGRLRALVVEGKISSEEFFDAIISQTDALQAAFANTVPTIGQATTVLSNSFTLLTGRMDAAVGASGAIAQAILILADNLDRVAAYAAAAAIGFGGAYVASLAVAAASTATLTGALTLLRTALIRTGIGALIIGAGELILWFGKLITATGGWGAALSALGSLASGIWEGIKTSASAIGPAIGAVWAGVQSDFLAAMSVITEAWSRVLSQMAGQAASIFLIGDTISKSLAAAAGRAADSMAQYDAQAQSAAAASAALNAEANNLVSTGWAKAAEAAVTLRTLMDTVDDTTADTTDSTTKLNNALNGTGGTSGAAKAAAKELKAMADEIERLEFDADPIKKYNADIKELDKLLAAGLSDGAYRKAVEDLNAELVESTPIISDVNDAFGQMVDYMFDGFKDGMKGILNIFVNTLKNMAATALKNKITFSLGMSVAGGTAGVASAAQATAGAGTSGLTGLLGSVGGIGSALVGGFSNAVGSLFGAGGGIGAMFANIGAQVSAAATGSLTAIAGAVGAIAAPVLAVAAAVSFFKTKTKLLDEGIRVTADNMGILVEEFERVEKSRFWGLSKTRNTDYDPASAEVADPIIAAITEIQTGFMDLGATMGLEAENFASFSAQIRLSLKGMSDEQAQQAIIDALSEFSEAFAGAALGWFDENIVGGVVREGETFRDTLYAMAGSLQLVNGTFEELGFALFDASVIGAKTARDFADAFGGWEGFAAGVSSYIDTFYSDAEKLEIVTKRIQTALDGIDPNNVNTAMESRDLFKALTDWAGSGAAVDPSQANLFAKLINVAPLIDQMFSLQESLAATDDAVGDVTSGVDELNRIATEQSNLLLREARLLGDTAYIRDQERAAIDASNLPILERIFALEDEQAAAEAAEAAARALADAQAAIASEAEGLMSRYERLMGDQESIRAREFAGIDEANHWILEMIHAREDEVAAMEAAEQAAAELEAALEAEAAKAREIADERAGLEKRILELLGDTAALRQLEIDAVDAANQHLVVRIHNILDEQAAAEATARAAEEAARALESERQAQEDLAAAARAAAQAIADEAYALETQWLQAIGDVAALRARELELLDPSNRAMQQKIWAYLDEQAALKEIAEAARVAEQALLDAAEAERQRVAAIADERYRLETRLYELQGNITLLRERELALLDPSNHELQKLIWSLEDAQAAANGATDGVSDLADVLGELRSEMREALSLVESLISTEIDAIQSAAQARIEALQSEIDMARDMAGVARDTLQGAFDVVRASIDADRTMLVAGYTAAIEALDNRMEAATANVDRLRGVFDLLDGALSSRLLGGAVREGARYMQAQSYIRGLTGLPANTDALEGALQALSGDGSRFYGSATDYEFDFLRTNAALSGLRDQAGGQLSDAERQVAAIEGARAAREAQHERELARLDDQLATAQGIYDEATGSAVELMDVGDGIDGLRAAAEQYTSLADQLLAIEAAAGAEIEAVRLAADAQVGLLEEQLAEARRSVEIAEGTYNSIETIQEAIDYLNQTIAAFSEANAAVNEQFAADTTQPIIDIPAEVADLRNENSEENARILEQNRQLTEEVRQLRDDVNQLLKSLVKNSSEVNTNIKRWEAIGLPPERTT